MQADYKPAYAPTQTFVACLRHLKQTGVPDKIDLDAVGLEGRRGTWSHVCSSLRSLALIDGEDRPTKALRKLVDALDSPKWSKAVHEHILPAYAPVFDAIKKDGENITRIAIEDEFRRRGCTAQDTLTKAVRFCTEMHEEAGERIARVDVTRAVREAQRRKSVRGGTTSARQSPGQMGAALHTHRFRLRPDLELRIALPGDLTLAEVNRFTKFLELVVNPE